LSGLKTFYKASLAPPLTSQAHTTKINCNFSCFWGDKEVEFISNRGMIEQAFQRNMGIIGLDQQKIIRNATVAIAGVGADGGLTAERLARLGVGHLKLADPGFFEESNLNRQFGSNLKTIGKNKAEAVAEEIKEIFPSLKIEIYTDGINVENVNDFVSNVNVVVDEIEYSRLDLSVLLHRAARRQGKFIFLGVNVGWGANLFVFDPGGMTLEEYCEIPPAASLEEIRKFKLSLDKFCPKVPEYVPQQVIQDVIEGKDIPSVSTACSLVASLLATEVVLFLIDKKRKIPVVPEYISIDLYRRELYVGNNC